MKPIVHQSLGYIHRFDSRGFLERTEVENKFVRDKAGCSRIEDGIVFL